MKKILMCFPEEFGVNYEINPWMNSNIGKVNYKLAIEQWGKLYNHLLNLGVDVIVIKNQPENLPDLVFTANAALTINNHALIANFECNERKPESKIYSDFIKRLGLSVDNFFIKNKISFEGAGDALYEKHNDTLVLAYGFRTNKNAYSYVKQFFKKVSHTTKLIQAELINPSFYHLDTCFCPLDNGYVLYNPEAFSTQTIENFKEAFPGKLITVKNEDAKLFGCNAISVGDNLILNSISEELEEKLNTLGINVIQTPLDQFMLSGGSAKCLTLELSLQSK